MYCIGTVMIEETSKGLLEGDQHDTISDTNFISREIR